MRIALDSTVYLLDDDDEDEEKDVVVGTSTPSRSVAPTESAAPFVASDGRELCSALVVISSRSCFNPQRFVYCQSITWESYDEAKRKI